MEKQKKEKAAKQFSSFFIKKPTSAKETIEEKKEESNGHFTQFRVKTDMRLAPIIRNEAFNSELMDSVLEDGNKESYLKVLKSDEYMIGSCGKTWPVEEIKKDDDDEVEIVEDDEDEDMLDNDDDQKLLVEENQIPKKKIRVKLLQFCENQRPPYWGTWSKKSPFVGARRPFGKDQTLFDYDYDSDDDWEEEEQGESLSDEEKDKEDDEEPPQDEDDDDGFFVGHGVLDKDEIHAEDDEDGEIEYDEELEAKKQKLRAQQFEEEYKKKKPVKLKPKVFGCMWIEQSKEEIAYEQLLRILNPYKCVMVDNENGPIPTSISSPKPSPSVANTPSAANKTPSADNPGKERPKKVFPEEAMSDLIRLVHVNQNSKVFIAKEFCEFWNKKKGSTEAATPSEDTTPNRPANELSRSKVLGKIAEMADYKKFEEEGPMQNRTCWVVKKEIMEKFEVKALPVPNAWEYILEVPKRIDLNKSTDNKETGTQGSSASNTPAKSKEEKKESKGKSIQALFKSMQKKKAKEDADDDIKIVQEIKKNDDASEQKKSQDEQKS